MIKTHGLIYRTLPAILGIVSPVIVLVIGIIFINQVRTYQSSANADKKPSQLKIGNATHNSISITWITSEPTTGLIEYGETQGSLNTKGYDIRDQKTKAPGLYLNHFIPLENLPPNRAIYYRIISSGSNFDDSGKPFTANTAIEAALTDNDIAQGKVSKPDNTPADGALVYFNLANTSPIIGLTDRDGRWMIPLSTARSSDLESISNYDRNSQVVDLTIVLGKENASATLTTKNDNPVPDIVLGQIYNFVDQYTGVPTSDKTNQIVNSNQTYPPATETPAPVTEIGIVYPAKDNEKVTSLQPEFIGFGPAGEKIEVVIHSDEQIKADTMVNKDRSWRWTPTTPLSPGEHTITVSYTDKDGFVKKTSKGFVVLAAQAAENEFLPSFTATGSGRQATPIPTRIPTTALSPTVAPSVTPFPTTVIPTLTLVPIATVTPAERTSQPENQGEVPASGNAVTTVVVGGVGLLIVVAGLAFLLF